MKRLLLFCAHPDDLIGCAGLTLRATGVFETHLIDFTTGDSDSSPDSVLASARRAEELAACAVAGIEPHFMNVPQPRALADAANLAALKSWLTLLNPCAIVTHWPLDVHPDHAMCAALTIKAVHETGADREILFFEETFQSKNFPSERTLDITPVMERKIRMIGCYASQNSASLIHAKTLDAEFRGSRINVRYAESYACFLRSPHGVLDELPQVVSPAVWSCPAAEPFR